MKEDHGPPANPEPLLELRRLAGAAPGLARLDPEAVLAAWADTVAAWRDPTSPPRVALDPLLTRASGLSPAGLAAGLEVMLTGVAAEPAARLFAAAAPWRRRGVASNPALVVLAASPPGLAVQPLLPALALGRPVLLKTSRREPFFAPAFVAALTARLPTLAAAVGVTTWRGGDETLERELLAQAGTVLAYGGAAATTSLAARAPGKTWLYGPKTSLGVLASDVSGPALGAALAGFARDIALFDQRGCLSIAAMYVEGGLARAEEVAAGLASALARQAEVWPYGLLDPAVVAEVQQLRATADLLGCFRPELPLTAGTVIVEPGPAFQPSPGLRTVRVLPLPKLAALPAALAPWAGQLQGAALAGEEAWALAPAFTALGLSRLAAPGELQHPDALWANGGVPPIEVLAGGAPPRLHRPP